MSSALSKARASVAARLAKVTRNQAGFTLIELLVAMSMLVAILAGSMFLLVSMMQKQPGLSDRSEQVAEARIALERMVREIRPGYAVESATGTSNTVTFRTYTGRTCQGAPSTTAVLCRITYTCTPLTGICTRSTANPDGSAPTAARRMIGGVTNADVFRVLPTSIGIRLVIPAEDGRGAFTVDDGATLRNATLTN